MCYTESEYKTNVIKTRGCKMKKVVLLGILILSLISVETAFCNQPKERWKDISYGIDEIDLKTVAIDPQDPDIIYAGSSKSIFKSIDNGETWQKAYMVRGTQTAVNIIVVDPASQDIVYAGTQNGLFKSTDAGLNWNKIFEGVGLQEKDIRHMVIDSADVRKIYIGTASGIFITNDAGRTFNKLNGEMSDQNINFIAQDFVTPDIIYCAASTGVFKSVDRGLTWKRIFTVAAQTEESETDETSDDTNTDETATSSNKTPNCIAIDTKDTDKIYIGTNCGVFASYDAGKTWEKLTSSGLINNEITSLAFPSNGSLYAASRNGVFKISKPYIHWDELYVGLISKNVQYLTYNKRNHSILAAAKIGVYKTHLNNADEENYQSTQDPEIIKLLSKFECEPAIQEIQEAAIRYAEVHKDKIDAWRHQARAKAILPSFSVSAGSYLTDYWHWDAGSNPDVLQKGKAATDWSVTASWDLSDFVWSADQTSIDVRSRLMVQTAHL